TPAITGSFVAAKRTAARTIVITASPLANLSDSFWILWEASTAVFMIDENMAVILSIARALPAAVSPALTYGLAVVPLVAAGADASSANAGDAPIANSASTQATARCLISR